MKTRIYIGTPQGAVQVERIWREDGIAESMACLKRTTEKLPIGAGYNDFVKRPSGIIEREFGPFDAGAFRLDLSATINQGKSWQLAVFTAHALARDGLLAGPDDPFERVIWLTGEVDSDLKVGAVSQVPEKIHSAVADLEALADAGKKTLIYVPEKNAEALANANLPVSIDGRTVGSAGLLLDAIGVPLAQDANTTATVNKPNAAPARTTARHGRSDKRHGKSSKRALLGFFLVGMGAAAIGAGVILPGLLTPDAPMQPSAEAVQQSPVTARTELDNKAEPPSVPENLLESLIAEKAVTEIVKAVSEPKSVADIVPPIAPSQPMIAIFAVHPSGNSGCPAVHFGADDGKSLKIRIASDGQLNSTAADDLCAIEFKFTPAPDHSHMAAGVELIAGHYVESQAMPTELRGVHPVAAPVTWRINLPLRMKQSLEYKVHLISSEGIIDNGIYKSLRQGDFADSGRTGLSTVSAHHFVSLPD